MATMEKFVLLQEHLLLLEHANFVWNGGEYGAPGIYSKKPYGNSDVLGDIARILGYKKKEVCPHCQEPLEEREKEEKDRMYMDRLHRETLTALQVITQARIAEPGWFCRVKGEDDHAWGKWSPFK